MNAPAGGWVQRAFWLWRLGATALAFFLFGLGGVLLRVIVFPLQRLPGGSPQQRQRRARRTVHGSFRLFIRLLSLMGVLTVRTQGVERLGRPGQMIIANHPSLLDVVILIGLVPDANCIVRHGLARNPFTRGPIAACGYITNDESMEMLERAAAVLQAGETLIVFPESTRTPPGALPRLHRGACAMALRGARVISPVLIRMRPRSLAKGEPWYRIPPRRMRYELMAGEDMPLAPWRNMPPPRAGRELLGRLHAWYASGLQADDAPAPPIAPIAPRSPASPAFPASPPDAPT